MHRRVLGTLAAAALSASGFALTAAAAEADQPSPRAERLQHWAADHETVLDAKLAGMKAGLGLSPDQEKLWSPFESAVRDAAKSRLDALQKLVESRDQGERLSPVDRLEAIADHLSQGAADIKKIAAAAKPLYDSLDDSQKHKFGMLGRMLLPERAQFLADMVHRHGGIGDGGPGGEE
jgi:hypothetical protein